MKLTLHSRHKKGGATYVNPENGARVQVSKKMFVDGVAPDEITEFVADNVAPASEKYAARAARAAAKAQKAVDLPAKRAKLAENLAKLDESIAKTSGTGSVSEEASA